NHKAFSRFCLCGHEKSGLEVCRGTGRCLALPWFHASLEEFRMELALPDLALAFAYMPLFVWVSFFFLAVENFYTFP
ncbi:hypothetical protein, partial [Pseudomonas aeruginosa]|uniref:hypothetical protein n=1 Tax=Pseudomonas aeruginosa TaxID=287 RepID=UPI001F4B02EE